MTSELDQGWLPSADVQASFVGSSGEEAMSEARAFWNAIRPKLYLPGDIQAIDVGVGWGRLYRIISQDIPDLVGLDVDPKAIEMCEKGIPGGRFALIEKGKLPVETNSKNFAFLYSVFSHLSEIAFRTSLRELKRVIRPGGYVAFTTFHSIHLDIWNTQYESKQPGYFQALENADFNAVEWKRRLDSGEMLFVPTGGGDDEVRPSDLYGEAIIGPAYLTRILPGSGFHLTYFDGSFEHPQTHVILRRDC